MIKSFKMQTFSNNSITCCFCSQIGSNEQLENTELCNGIVQDEPEVILQSTEKIEILFNRIKLSTKPAAQIYGNVLCLLTKVMIYFLITEFNFDF